MARKPAILEMNGGKSQRQRVWEAIRGFAGVDDGTFDTSALSITCKVELPVIREYLKALATAGYVTLVSTPGLGVKNVYELTQDNGVEAPRVRRDGTPVTQGRGNEAMWAAMTVLDLFSHWMLAEIAQVKPVTAAGYCKALGKAGYLRVVTAGKGTGKGGVATVWALDSLHRMKPRAPMITRLKSLYDPNTHEIVWAEGADEAADAVEIGEVL